MKRPHLQKLSSDIVTPGHLISCPILVIDITFVLFFSQLLNSMYHKLFSRQICNLLVTECVPILPVVELFWRSVHLPKQDFLGTNRNAGNYFLLHKSELTCQKHSSNICKHINCEKVTRIELFVAGDKHHFDICNHLLAAEQLQLPTHGANLFTVDWEMQRYLTRKRPIQRYTCQCVSWSV